MRIFILTFYLCSVFLAIARGLPASPQEKQGKMLPTQYNFSEKDAKNFSTAMLLAYIPYFEFLKINMNLSNKEFLGACQSVLLSPLSPRYVKTLDAPVKYVCSKISKLDKEQFKKAISDIKYEYKDAYMEAFDVYVNEMPSINEDFLLVYKRVDDCLKDKERRFLEGDIKEEACVADDKLQDAIKKYRIAYKETKAKIRNVYYAMLLSFMGTKTIKSIEQDSRYMVFYNYFIGSLSNMFAFTSS